MARVEIGKHLAVDNRKCGGRLIFNGTRIMVADAVELSGRGYSPEEIANQYYGIIQPEAVKEALSLIRRGLIKEVAPKPGKPRDNSRPQHHARSGRTPKSVNSVSKGRRGDRAAELG